MRVMAMIPDYPPRGVGSWVMTHNLLRALVERGHQADVVLSAADGDPYELDGVRVWPLVDKSDPFRFIDDAHVIVAHVESASRALMLGEIRGVPVAQIAHNANAFTEAALRKRPASLTVFNSVQVSEKLAGLCCRSIIVRPPVRAEDYETVPGGAVTLINLSEDKGAETFYQLAERLPKTAFLGVRGGYGVQVLPRGPEDLPNVEILGHVRPDQMRDRVYARTRVLLMPSAHESWGRTGVEAMTSGIPVLAHPAPGLRESLGAAGTFVDRDDLDGWERSLRLLLDGRRWRAASRRAKARAVELDPTADLDRWCTEIEALGRRRLRVRSRVAG
ncbi:glycosyltransferase family 4 protein [Actinomadura rubrisoli]|uniref:Glycosyltransferase n=1 Tax=Actinomadura rubrisoli TaxID=2530368 RepID=A0A4R5CF55_9ACTN|nr:glycosyltransferase family 4 protein [Actinomadura rubrisoli]TDD97639.1 glycosyltransferase [Actinomadura rubrisoli]